MVDLEAIFDKNVGKEIQGFNRVRQVLRACRLNLESRRGEPCVRPLRIQNMITPALFVLRNTPSHPSSQSRSCRSMTRSSCALNSSISASGMGTVGRHIRVRTWFTGLGYCFTTRENCLIKRHFF